MELENTESPASQIPDLNPEEHTISTAERKVINNTVENLVNKEQMAEERLQQELSNIKSKHKQEEESPRDVLKSLIAKGEMSKVYEHFGAKWTLRALDQNDLLLISEDIKDDVNTMAGRMMTTAFLKVVFSIEEINGKSVYTFFPEIEPTAFATRLQYILAVKKSLKVYLESLPPLVTDILFDDLQALEAERDEALLELKN